MRNLRTFSFTDEDKDVLDHIDKQKNKSKYIKKVVRKDIQEEKIPSDLKKIIDNYIEQKLK